MREEATLQVDDILLFQGDSITNAFRKPEEINDAYQMGNGYAFLIGAELKAKHPELNLTILNRGVSGNGLDDLSARWEPDCLRLAPTVVSLLIGINATLRRFKGSSDSNQPLAADVPFHGFRNLYHSLLERTCHRLDSVRLVICGPFILTTGQVTEEWAEDLWVRAEIAKEMAHLFGAIYVPLQCEFDHACKWAPPEYWAYDGYHPTAAGHHLIARAWKRAVLEPEL